MIVFMEFPRADNRGKVQEIGCDHKKETLFK
jgi:hypothetical protein